MAVIINDMLSMTTYAVSSLALMNNCVLLVIYFCCPLKNVNAYRYFFMLAAIQDMTFSMTLILAVPRNVSQKFYFIFISTGWMNEKPYGYIPLLLISVSYFTSLLLVTNGFIYRYLQVCKTHLFNIYSTLKNKAIGVVINLVLVASHVFVVYVCFWPNEQFAHLVHQDNVTNFDVLGSTFLGFSTKYRSNWTNETLVLSNLMILLLMEYIHFFCARKIAICIRKSALSNRSQTLQRQMFILLLVQAVCPVIFLHIPTAASLLCLFAGFSTTSTAIYAIGVLMALYPFFNPLIVVIFVRDYRNFVLINLRLRADPQQTNTSITPHKRLFFSTRE
ncbi:hypothetical protein Y032_0005g2354 [Ancylostoma ceylanicum]|uniref:G-protein coupled receptors family 1 profile domain-containing protein n=2 Tax=Ancylostoma ceylanicum TaxID=53326 RepID=A0A016VQV5_9BILA|nr:hypothetical protein Y032_0005g2354 [Ancylostoma ceylanicum]